MLLKTFQNPSFFDLVVNFECLVVKITSLVLIVKIWKTLCSVEPTEKGLGSFPKALINEKKTGSHNLHLVFL